LQDATGKVLVRNKHLLSTKDLNQSENLEKLLDAGVSSLKIEGRLKETSYVKNITAYYRQKLDAIFEKRPEYVRASSGTTTLFFVPDPVKSFNRGFTSYFLLGKREAVVSPDTPKFIGEPVGNVKNLSRNFFTISGQKTIHNGDGLCFFNKQKRLQGFLVNKAIAGKIYPAEKLALDTGVTLYRNLDREFEKTLAQKSAERKINVNFVLTDEDFGFCLTATDEDACQTDVFVAFPKDYSSKNPEENCINQLSKLGNTPFQLEKLTINFLADWFIPSSVLNNLRRRAVEDLLAERKNNHFRPERKIPTHLPVYPKIRLSYLDNVTNRKARTCYIHSGVKIIAPAFEKEPQTNVPVMFTKHCILYQLGYCKKDKNARNDFVEPLFLLSGKKQFKLQFDCRRCEMQVINQ
jgi:putative protease